MLGSCLDSQFNVNTDRVSTLGESDPSFAIALTPFVPILEHADLSLDSYRSIRFEVGSDLVVESYAVTGQDKRLVTGTIDADKHKCESTTGSKHFEKWAIPYLWNVQLDRGRGVQGDDGSAFLNAVRIVYEKMVHSKGSLLGTTLEVNDIFFWEALAEQPTAILAVLFRRFSLEVLKERRADFLWRFGI